MIIDEVWLHQKCIKEDREYIVGKEERLSILLNYQFAGDNFNPSVFLELKDLYFKRYGQVLEYPKDNRLDSKMFSLIKEIKDKSINRFIKTNLL